MNIGNQTTGFYSVTENKTFYFDSEKKQENIDTLKKNNSSIYKLFHNTFGNTLGKLFNVAEVNFEGETYYISRSSLPTLGAIEVSANSDKNVPKTVKAVSTLTGKGLSALQSSEKKKYIINDKDSKVDSLTKSIQNLKNDNSGKSIDQNTPIAINKVNVQVEKGNLATISIAENDRETTGIVNIANETLDGEETNRLNKDLYQKSKGMWKTCKRILQQKGFKKLNNGEAVRTVNTDGSHLLHARFGKPGMLRSEEESLNHVYSATYNALLLAKNSGLKTVYLPEISSGTHKSQGSWSEKASKAQMKAIEDFSKSESGKTIENIHVVVFDPAQAYLERWIDQAGSANITKLGNRDIETIARAIQKCGNQTTVNNFFKKLGNTEQVKVASKLGESIKKINLQDFDGEQQQQLSALFLKNVNPKDGDGVDDNLVIAYVNCTSKTTCDNFLNKASNKETFSNAMVEKITSRLKDPAIKDPWKGLDQEHVYDLLLNCSRDNYLQFIQALYERKTSNGNDSIGIHQFPNNFNEKFSSYLLSDGNEKKFDLFCDQVVSVFDDKTTRSLNQSKPQIKEFNNYGIKIIGDPEYSLEKKMITTAEGTTKEYPLVKSFTDEKNEKIDVKLPAIYDETDQKVYQVSTVFSGEATTISVADNENHDACAMMNNGCFMAVADGSGTGPNSTNAAQRASKTAVEHYQNNTKSDLTIGQDIKLQLQAVKVAQEKICNLENCNNNSAQTTFVSSSIRGNRLSGVAIGDAPIYILRKNENNQWVCRSPFAEREGNVQETGGHLKSTKTQSSLSSQGIQESPQIARLQVFSTELHEGDIIIQATDGLSDGLTPIDSKGKPSDPEKPPSKYIEECLNENDRVSTPEEITETLQARISANSKSMELGKLQNDKKNSYNGKSDNASWIIVSYKPNK